MVSASSRVPQGSVLGPLYGTWGRLGAQRGSTPRTTVIAYADNTLVATRGSSYDATVFGGKRRDWAVPTGPHHHFVGGFCIDRNSTPYSSDFKGMTARTNRSQNKLI